MKRNAGSIALLMLLAMNLSCSSADAADTSVNTEDSGPPTACGWPSACLEDLCRKEDCGGPASAFDEDGCYRPNCETDLCEAGHECREVQYSPVTFSGVMEDGTCMVGWQGIIITTKMCFPVVGD